MLTSWKKKYSKWVKDITEGRTMLTGWFWILLTWPISWKWIQVLDPVTSHFIITLVLHIKCVIISFPIKSFRPIEVNSFLRVFIYHCAFQHLTWSELLFNTASRHPLNCAYSTMYPLTCLSMHFTWAIRFYHWYWYCTGRLTVFNCILT